jgi:hypothetical protein
MPASRRRAAARVSFAIVVTVAISFAAPGAVQAATNPMTIAVKVGYTSFVKAQQWMPVTIDVTNKGPEVDGTLEVTTPASTNGPPIGAVVYRAHLNVPPGSSKHLRTYLIEDQAPAPVSVRIVQNGRTVASADSSGSSVATTLIGVLSDQPTALDSFSAVHPGSIAATVVHLSPEEVGDSAVLLRAFDLVAIDDYASDTLTSAQRGALTDYVQNGGNLLLGTGASWRKTLGGVSPSILPMQPAATTTLGPASAFDGLPGIEIATGTVSAVTDVWLSQDGSPLLAERPVGSGLVTIATFDWNRSPVAGSTGADALLRQVLVRTVFNGASAQGVNFVKGPFGGGGSSGGSITERSSSVSSALSSLPALDLPSLLVIGILILVYVLFVGPVNYFALRALNHRALAWVTVPLIAIVASAGAFGAGLFTKGRSVQTNQVSVVHLQPAWDHAYEESYTGVLTPTRGDYQVTVGNGHPMVAPLFSYNGGAAPGSSSDLIQVGTDTSTITLPGMTAFALRGFGTEDVVASPQLVATVSLVNGKLTGTIRNDSTVSFTDEVVLAGDAYQLLPALRPGATATFSVVPKASNPTNGPPAIATIYTNYVNGPLPNQQPTEADREGLEKSAILSLVAPANFGGASLAIAPMFVGWTKQSYQQVTVAGSQAHATSETAVVLPLAVDSFGAGPVPSGMIVSRYADIEGDSQQGPPTGVETQNGTVTYTFTPRIASGLHITNATLDTSNQIQMGGPPGTAQTLVVKAWSWSTSTWVLLNYSNFGATSLPDSVVNPASNEVRLQMTAQGTLIFLGQISLTGTVK